MSDSQRLLGHLFITGDERLQDILNDDRQFLPLYALGDNGKHQLIVLSKRYIQQVEEVVSLSSTVPDVEHRTLGDRRSGVDRRDVAEANKPEPKLTPPKLELD